MEITNEIKAKVFSQYIGYVKMQWYNPLNNKYAIEKKLDDTSVIMLSANIETLATRNLEIRLILKPLSELTIEDAREAIKIWGEAPYVFGAITIDSRPAKWSRVIIEHSDKLPHFVFQYLISKGYDVPQYLLGGKTLKESGLAIYNDKN